MWSFKIPPTLRKGKPAKRQTVTPMSKAYGRFLVPRSSLVKVSVKISKITDFSEISVELHLGYFKTVLPWPLED